MYKSLPRQRSRHKFLEAVLLEHGLLLLLGKLACCVLGAGITRVAPVSLRRLVNKAGDGLQTRGPLYVEVV